VVIALVFNDTKQLFANNHTGFASIESIQKRAMIKDVFFILDCECNVKNIFYISNRLVQYLMIV